MRNYENIKNYTILYVEDEKQSVELVQHILQNKVKDIIVAYDGVDGLEKYKKHLPDIVITDIQMPNMNGIVLSKEIKKINPKQNIILVTAFNENHLLLEAINLGINKYIIKPIISIENLLQPIDDICKILSFDKNIKNETRVQAMEEILKTIAHHWRQPLNIISITSSTVKLEMELGVFDAKSLSQKLETINQTTQELSEMIDNFINMFDYNKTEEKNSFLLLDALETILKKFEKRIKASHIKIVTHLNKNLIKQNQTLVEQIILNILENSIEAIEENNSNTKERYILITSKIKNNSTILSIQDSGGGIEQHLLTKVFEPYFSNKKIHSGSGMGLYIVNKIVENHLNTSIELNNNSFEIEDKLLYGANVSIVIP